jgi:hypothetical protein
MKRNILLVLWAGVMISYLIVLSACSSVKVKRELATDPGLRVLIDPRIPVEQYVEIQRALVDSGKVEVVDRRDGFTMAIAEQDLQARSGYQDRFSDREKWAHIGKMYGAASIVTAHASCYQKNNLWGTFTRYCKQTLFFINGRTGVIEITANGENSVPWTAEFVAPDWDDTVASVIKKYPKYFEPRPNSKLLETYRDQSAELAQREREKVAPHPVIEPDVKPVAPAPAPTVAAVREVPPLYNPDLDPANKDDAEDK